jgi:hypothetical protein
MLRYHCWMLMNFYPKGAIEIPEGKAPVEITEALIRKVENDAEYRIHESACMVLADVLAITEGAEDPGAAAFEIVKRYEAMVRDEGWEPASERVRRGRFFRGTA